MLRKFLCTDLKTGGVILGWLGATFSFLYIVVAIVTLVNIDDFLAHQVVDTQKMKPQIVLYISINTAFTIINLFASSMLIYGAIKHNRMLLLPWLIDHFLSILLMSLAILIAGMVLVFSKETLIAGIVVFVAGFCICLVYLYFWLAIYSLYRELKEDEIYADRLLTDPVIGTTQINYSSLA